MRESRAFFFFLSLSLLGHPSTGDGRTIPVGESGTAKAGALRSAVLEAADGDTIVVYPGEYRGVALYINGKNLVLRSAAGPEKTILDGEQSGLPILWIRRVGAGALVEGFTIRNGTARQSGGGILVGQGSNPVIRGNIFEKCEAPWGAGLYVSPRADPLIEGNLFTGNIAGAAGGGVYAQNSRPTIRNNTFVGNNAERPGSAICLYNSSATVERNLIVESLGLSAVHLMTKSSKPAMRCNAFWKNSGTDIDAVEGGTVPAGTDRKSGDPLFAGGKTYRLSRSSPFLNAGGCGKIGW